MLHFQELFEKLSLSKSNGLFIYEEKGWGKVFSVKIEKTLDILQPYAFFVFNSEPLILFFSENQNDSRTHIECWNFNVTPIIFFVSETDISIYNAFAIKDTETNKPLLEKLATKNELDKFSYWNLASGLILDEYKNKLNDKNRVDKWLLKNIKDARDVLKSQKLNDHITNNLIGRLIFIRYLIDRKVFIRFGEEKNSYLNENSFLDIIRSKETLYNLFKYIHEKFQGDLFPIDENEFNNVETIHLNTLYHLFKGDNIGSGQVSLFDTYRFDIIPIEFISNIYEYFMGEGKKKDQKAYYTPTFLVNYMLNHTVTDYFEKKSSECVCRVLDPTCGSGIFLVEAFRRIVEQNERLFGSITNQSEKLKQIATNNIFGIDKDKDAVNVAMFSLYITLLDYQDPKDIESFKFPPLLNKNFFVQDIFRYSIKDLQFELFESQEQDNYIAKLLDTDFQFIIGNPPWGQVSDSPYMQRIEEIGKNEGIKIEVSDKQFAQAFLVRTKDFSKKDTKCAVVIASKILYNNNADVFRKFFLDKFFIDKILELSPVRKDVFINNEGEKAIAPSAILFYNYAHNQVTDNNIVTHTSIKHNIFYKLLKVLVIEKNDVKRLKQSNFKKYDWIWKVLLYGNVLDFQFIRRLKESANTIQSLIDNKDDFVYGTGLIKEDKYVKEYSDFSEFLGKRYLDTQKKYLSAFKISIPKDTNWRFALVKTPRDKRIYKPPMLLIKEGVTRYFNVSSCIADEVTVFTNSIASIKSLNNDFKALQNLEGLFNSNLFTYFQLHTGSSIGVERERILREELYSFPYKYGEDIAQLSELIGGELKTIDGNVDFYKVIKNQQTNLMISYEKVSKLKTLYSQLNEAIFDLYDLNDIEKSLIDYAENYSIPLFHNEERAFKQFNNNNKNKLEAYSDIFYEHFSKVFDGSKGAFFQIEILLNRFFVCMICKVLTEKPSENINIVWDDNLGRAGFLTKVTLFNENENLFIQKDIKHFESNEFFIIKPNEMKCWHKAMAYRDLFEIREELIKSSQQKITNV